MDVLGHVAIKKLKGLRIGQIAPIDSANFFVLRSSEFRVLNPQIRLELFQCLEELENRNVSLCDWCTVVVIPFKSGQTSGQQSDAHRCGPRCHHSVCQEYTPVGRTLHTT